MRFGGREYKTPANLGKEAAAGVNTPYSHAAKADSERRESADGFAAKMKRTKAGCRVY